MQTVRETGKPCVAQDPASGSRAHRNGNQAGGAAAHLRRELTLLLLDGLREQAVRLARLRDRSVAHFELVTLLASDLPTRVAVLIVPSGGTDVDGLAALPAL